MGDELLASTVLATILQDSFGNYVIQTALSVCDQRQYAELAEVLKPLLHLVKNTPYGKKIESRLNKKATTPQSPSSMGNGSPSTSTATVSKGSSKSRTK